jgi:RimJ/RimL family protein N-acetyltransferase
MNLQPTLGGDLLELRPLQNEDESALFEAASDPLIWAMHPQPDRYKPEVFRSFFTEALASQGALVVIDISNLKIIGTSRYYDFEPQNSSVVIGYTFLTREYWGGRYNWELKKLMVNYALNFVKTTYFHVGLCNIRSQKAMIKVGGINTGVQEIPVTYAPPKKSFVYKIETKL